MEGTDFTFTKWDRVRLRDNVDPAFYGNFACVGNEGWIADIRKDSRFGLPEVYIKWDKNHWTYNGAPDRWTFQDHFELVGEEEEKMSDNEDELFKKFQAFLKGSKQEPEQLRGEGLHDDKNSDTSSEQYAAAVSQVTDLLNECEGFVVMGVARRDHPEAKQGVLVPIAAEFAQNPESGLMAFSAMAKYAAEAYQDLTIQVISGFLTQKKRDNG